MKAEEVDGCGAQHEPRRSERATPTGAADEKRAPYVKGQPPGPTPFDAGLPLPARSTALTIGPPPWPDCLPREWQIVLGDDGHAYGVRINEPNLVALRVGSHAMNAALRAEAASRGHLLRAPDLDEANETLRAYAEACGGPRQVWNRVAEIPSGVEIDLGDDRSTRVRITPGKVEILRTGSRTLFYRSRVSRPLALPATEGDLRLLDKYVNLHPAEIVLLIAWISYTLAHPKVATTQYPILVLQGGQGRGKTSLTKNVILRLIDPTIAGVQLLPSSAKDFAIAAQSAHVLAFDNVRAFKPATADMLCIAATGGTASARQLYTDAEQQVFRIHVALILNGIHSFINQGDLAQRCLPLQLRPLAESKRQSERVMVEAFEAELPKIQRGIFDLIAGIFAHLPNVTVTNPERMIDFSRWLAAMEVAEGVPPGVYQAVYSDVLHQGQLDTLLDNVLGAAIVEFADSLSGGEWSGTPTEFHRALTDSVPRETARSRDWPPNPIALSRRLRVLEAGLHSQGIRVESSRGKNRVITVTDEGGRDA